MQIVIFADGPRPKFDLGRILATPNALEHIPIDEISTALGRHSCGDWGTIDDEDIQANENALLKGGRLFSGYNSIGDVRFWIITEADRSSTTILLPEDY
jgi:hypothetical protein